MLALGRPASTCRPRVQRVYVDPAVVDYAVRLVDRHPLRPALVGLSELDRYVTFGASPRASIALLLGGPRARVPAGPGLRAAPRTWPNSPSRCCATASSSPTRRWPTTSMPDTDHHRSAASRARTGCRAPEPLTVATAQEKLLLRLEWRVIRRLDGRLQGDYRTAHRGAGIDFAGFAPTRRATTHVTSTGT